jgi:hypothetical protein
MPHKIALCTAMTRSFFYLCKRLLPRILERNCPSRFPRSGEKGARVNCFVVAIEESSDPHWVVNTLVGTTLDCAEWDGDSYSLNAKVDLTQVQNRSLKITHYFGLSEVRYVGIYDLLIGRCTGWPYLKIWVYRSWDKVAQFFFSRRRLVTKQRMDLLKLLVDRHTAGPIGIFDLMTNMYSIRWVLHPDREAQRRKLELYLDSLVRSGDVKLVDHDYAVTGQALSTLEKYEEEERRHAESVGVQRRMWWLTLLIALLTLVQAGIIKLPVLVDLSGLSK